MYNVIFLYPKKSYSLKKGFETMTDTVIINRPELFDINQIFDCGQCFRFDPDEADSAGTVKYSGVAFGKHISVSQTSDRIILDGASKKDFEKLWKHFFALDADYSEIRKDIETHFGGDETIRSALEYGKGIRILRQDPWETLCSFIVSQNNNIPRIKKIISEMSREFGKPIEHNKHIYYSFPEAETLALAGEEKIFALKTGFRAKYIYSAAEAVASGRLDLEKLKSKSTESVLETLMTIKGVGLKVASCAALFGFGKTDAFPVDVWIKRVLEKYYPDGLDISSLGKYAGISQQYLFYYERYRN